MNKKVISLNQITTSTKDNDYIREMRPVNEILTPININGQLFQIANETSLSIVVTDFCNANCGFCINETGIKNSGIAVAHNFDQKMDKAISLFNVRDAVLLGGEPLIARHIQNILDGLDKVKDQLDEVTITTNGTQLRNQKTLEMVANSPITSINISYHHYDKKINDAIMKTNTLTIEEIHNLSRFFKSIGKTVRINMVAFKGGIDNAEKLERYANHFAGAVDMVKINPVYPTQSYLTTDAVSRYTKGASFSKQEWMQMIHQVNNRGNVIQHHQDIFEVERTLVKLKSGIKYLMVNPYTDCKDSEEIRSLKILSNGKLSLSWLLHDPDLMNMDVYYLGTLKIAQLSK